MFGKKEIGKKEIGKKEKGMVGLLGIVLGLCSALTVYTFFTSEKHSILSNLAVTFNTMAILNYIDVLKLIRE
jgi:hypothetical protein